LAGARHSIESRSRSARGMRPRGRLAVQLDQAEPDEHGREALQRLDHGLNRRTRP
jgi:hypothetical protein